MLPIKNVNGEFLEFKSHNNFTLVNSLTKYKVTEDGYMISTKGVLKEFYCIGKGFIEESPYSFLNANSFQKRVDSLNKGIKKRLKKSSFAGEWIWFESENFPKSEDSKSMAQRENEFETVSFSSEFNDSDTSNLTAMISQLGVDNLFRYH